jgi:hypothetical protein
MRSFDYSAMKNCWPTNRTIQTIQTKGWTVTIPMIRCWPTIRCFQSFQN